MQSEVSMAGADQDRGRTVEELERELSEAHRRETATAEVLRVIGSSPTDVQPVFDTIVRNAVRLCNGLFSSLYQFDGELIHQVAHHNYTPEALEESRRMWPRRPERGLGAARAIHGSAVVHIPDVELDTEFEYRALARAIGWRSGLFIPMLREGAPIGAFSVTRAEPGPFSDNEIELLKTFADQAVIAIENARLFEAEQTRTRALTERTQELSETLKYQTATSEVLNVISRSPSQLQPVLDTIVETAGRLCQADYALIFRLENGKYRLIAASNAEAEFVKHLACASYDADRSSLTGRVAIAKTTIHIPDVLDDSEDARGELQKLGKYRSVLGVPLMRDGQPIGVINLSRTVVHPFTEKQIEVITTFADQAVIAIENTRLFEAEQTRTKELAEALEQQTATSEVLGVISSSPGELEPVFQAMLANATRICEAKFGAMYLFEGDAFRAVALHGGPPSFVEARRRNPVLRPIPGTGLGRVAATKQTVQIADVQVEPAYRSTPENAIGPELGGLRTVLCVPMLKEDELIGAFNLFRQEVRPFTDKQIALVTNFAAQAVIAIENTRLLNELRESLQQQTTTAEILRVIASTPTDVQPVFDAIVANAARLCDATFSAVVQFEGGLLHLVAVNKMSAEETAAYRTVYPRVPNRSFVIGRAFVDGRPAHVEDIEADPDYDPHTLAILKAAAPYRTYLGIPILRDGVPIGAIGCGRREVKPFTEAQIALMETFADQAVIAIENTRLFEEVQARTRELATTIEKLEIASQHKSQFVANMSHELRTPLAAILGYAELMQEGFYEPQGPKSRDALARIGSNGKHLLGLINTVLDIAKIESGQFNLNMAEYAIDSMVETVRVATESLAQNKKLTLTTEVVKSLPIGLGDEQRLTQVLLNLVGNAIKFTDTGEVRVTAKGVNGHFNVTVADTGPGIPPTEQTRIFEQFHQVDSSLTKAKGGTGLGLAIAKQIVEMHGGRIWVESTVGEGTTFHMEIPTRATTT